MLEISDIKNPFLKKQINSNRQIIRPTYAPTIKKEIKIQTRDGSFLYSFDNKKLSEKTLDIIKSNTKIANKLNDWFGLNSDFSFRLVSEKTDDIKNTHYTYKQYYKGISIYGGTVLLHFKQGNAYAINGKIAEFDDLDTSVSINEAQALENAKAYKNVTELIKDYPIKKVIYKLQSQNNYIYTLAYIVKVESNQPFVFADVFVDAKTSKVVSSISNIYDRGGWGNNYRIPDVMPNNYEPPETLYGNFTNRNIKLFLGALIIGFLIYKYNKK